VQQHQREQPHGLGLVGHQRGHQLAQSDRLRAELRAEQFVAGGCGVALAEDEVEHGEHEGEPLGQLVVGRDPEGDPGVADLALGAHQALRHRRLGDQERAGDLRRGQPAHRLQRQRHPRLLGERRMSAGEDQAQPLVPDPDQAVGREVHDLARFAGVAGLLVLSVGGALTAQPVERPVTRDRDEPLRRRVRNAGRWPVLQRRRGGLLQRLLGELEIPQPVDERRQHPRPIGKEDAPERLAGRLGYGAPPR
jgi:hypothetical protein